MLPNQDYTPEDIIRIARRRRWLIVLPVVLMSAAAFVYARTLPNIYRSETFILVVPQRVPESYVKSTVTARIEDRLSTIQQQILSRSRLERIITDLDLYPKERRTMAMEEVVARMRPDIHVTIDRGDGFRVSHDNRDPRLAQQVTERLAALFIEENLRDREVLADGTNEFLDAQLAEAKARLIDHERRLEQYRTAHSGELPSQVESNLQAIQRIQVQVQGISESSNRDKERRLALERQLLELESATPQAAAPVAIVPGVEPPVAAGVSTAQQLEDALGRLEALQARYTPEHPDVLAGKRTIRDLQRKLQAENTNVPPTADRPARALTPAEANRQNQLRALREQINDVDRQLQARVSEERRLQQQIAAYQAKADAAPLRESELVELTRDYGTLQTTYTALLAKRQDAKMASSLERRQVGEQFKVLDPARVPERPFSPNRLRLQAIGAAAGFAIGLGLVALFEYRDRSIKTAEEFVRVLQVPVLALVPLMQSPAERESVSRRRKRFGAAAVALAMTASATLYVLWLKVL